MMTLSTQDVSSRIRIFIADDHAMIRTGLRKVLESQPDMEVVGEAADGEAAVKLTLKSKPDVLLLDLAMPYMTGIDALRNLAQLKVATKTILLTASIDRPRIVESVKIGARGVILKEASSDLLCKCIRIVASGQYWVDHRGVSDIVHALMQSAQEELTEPRDTFSVKRRDMEIVEYVQQVGGRMDIG